MHPNQSYPETRIIPENRDAIEEALAFVNGRSMAHTYHHYEQIESLAAEAERKALELVGIPAYLPGARYCTVSGRAGKTDRARKATWVTLVRSRSEWILAHVMNTTIHREPPSPKLLLAQPVRAGHAFIQALEAAFADRP